MTQPSTTAQPLRLWPAWIILVLLALAMVLTVTPAINNELRFYFMMGGPVLSIPLFIGWLLFAGRLPGKVRSRLMGGAFGLICLGLLFAHSSMATAYLLYGIPLMMLIVTVGLARHTSLPIIFSLIALSFAGLNLLKMTGFNGAYQPELEWRWSTNPEESLVATATTTAAARAPMSWTETTPHWPHFRGKQRNGVDHEIHNLLDWTNTPPLERWRIAVGPGWSSFAAVGERLFTQEQRGEQEFITCYDASKGTNIWQYSFPARFAEVVSGPGPRATPTYADGKIFVLGATGLLCALDATSGSRLWQHDLRADTKAPLPVWGFSSSPLMVDDLVIVYAGGEDTNGLLAYEAGSGTLKWSIASQGENYSSAQLLNIDGKQLLLFAESSGLMAADPRTGELLWRFQPDGWKGTPIVQSQQVGAHDLIVPLGDGAGIARLEVRFSAGSWQLTNRWSSRAMKPSFNGFVVHEAYLYGFDQNIFVCVNMANGKRQWKKGRYGFGQALLLAQQGQIVVQAEDGDLVLLAADPQEHRELARLEVLKGKTWNHPIVADGQLIVRNGSEAVSLALDPAHP